MNFTAFDRALRHAADRPEMFAVALYLTTEDEVMHCKVVEVDQYFIRVVTSFDGSHGEEWINKAHIVRCRISVNGEDS